jgi:plasmid replication initiation protein
MSQFARDVDSPLLGSIKNDRRMMVWNFFSIVRERQTKLPIYDDGRVRIEVFGTEAGVATIWDKELLIYVASIMQDKMNRGEAITDCVTFTAYDFFRVTGTKPTGSAYERLEEALTRLQGTQVKTNIETGGEGETNAFSWVQNYRIEYRRSKNGEKSMRSVTIQICPWLFRAIQKDGWMLTYDHRFFELGPIEKRLYEIARAHCGQQSGFKIGIEKLRQKVGTENDLRRFKSKLLEISHRRVPLPGYGLSVIDPRQRLSECKAQKPVGRTPLRSYLVFFYKTDRLNCLPTFDQVPDLTDDLLT